MATQSWNIRPSGLSWNKTIPAPTAETLLSVSVPLEHVRLTTSSAMLQGREAMCPFSHGQTACPGDKIPFWERGSLEGNEANSLHGLARLHPDRTKHPPCGRKGEGKVRRQCHPFS